MPSKPRARAKTEIVLHGLGVSPGVVIGPAFVLVSEGDQVVERKIPRNRVEAEIGRFEDAIIETRRQLKQIQKDLETTARASDTSILDAHLMVLDDRVFLEEVIAEIKTKQRNAEAVVKTVSDKYAAVLASVGDAYLRERIVDVKDVASRVIRNLQGSSTSVLGTLNEKHIIVAQDLEPSETASLDKKWVMGFVTDHGSPTAHTAVLARALEIPAIVGLRSVTQVVVSGDELLMDGNRGIMVIHPSKKRLRDYGKVAEARESIRKELTELKDERAVTKDGRQIVLSANVEGADEVGAVGRYGAHGVGLFRSEYLFISRKRQVGEDEQTQVYQQIAARLAPAPVIIRTLDLGGDKYVPDGQARIEEANPFLGCRSIRRSLMYPDEFKSQMRAILKANKAGNVKIMYPMVSTVEELIKANVILQQAKDELIREGVDFQPDIDVGVMIEIPSAALSADSLAAHVDFFSIGTNDLVQYTFAVDRVNERVAYLYQPTHPSVLQLIKLAVEAGHRHKIWVGLCGEMAADPLVTPLLVGLGLDELSVNPSSVPLIKDAVRSITLTEARELATAALACTTSAEVLGLCREMTRKVAPELLELV